MDHLQLEDLIGATLVEDRHKAGMAPNTAVLRADPIRLVVVPVVDKVGVLAHHQARLLTVRKGALNDRVYRV